jgi:NitT/TauT family transport system substrate-binding protein
VTHTAFSILTLFFLLLSPTVSGQSIKLRSGYSVLSIGQSVLWVTKEAGIFKKNGLDAELLYLSSATVSTQALIATNLQIAIMSGTPAVNAALQGSDLIIVGSMSKTAASSFFLTSKDITQPHQLRGKRVGIARLGDSSDFMMRHVLKGFGLIPDKDVAFIQIGGGSTLRMQALAKGVVDATLSDFSEMIVAKKLGYNVLLDLSKAGVEVLNSDMVTTRTFAKRSSETVRAFVKSMIEGLHFYKVNKKFSTHVIALYTRSKDTEKIDLGYDHQAKTYLSKPYPNVKGIHLALEQIGVTNPTAKTAPIDQFFDSSFVKDLDESGYIDSLYK